MLRRLIAECESWDVRGKDALTYMVIVLIECDRYMTGFHMSEDDVWTRVFIPLMSLPKVESKTDLSVLTSYLLKEHAHDSTTGEGFAWERPDDRRKG
jgi:hypothetical protein